MLRFADTADPQSGRPMEEGVDSMNYRTAKLIQLAATAACVTVPVVAVAQERPAPSPPQGASGSATSTPDRDDSADIVVTGSRIARSGYDSPSPVAVTNAEQIERSGVGNVYDLLNRSPVFGIGSGPSSVGAYGGETGAQFVNLRGLGTNRTLVLVNGQRRVSGASSTSAVDLSSIPTSMIDRIEVVTGGAAAIYGADAVTGAVNILLKDKIDGIQLTTRQGLSSRGDGYSSTYGVLIGGPIGDRGRITVGASYNYEAALYQRDRSYTRSTTYLTSNPANTGPNDGIFDNIAVANARFPDTSYGGTFTIGGTRYTYDNGVRPIHNDSLLYGPDSYFGVGGDGFNGSDFDALRSGSKVFSALTHLTYKVFDGVNLTTDLQFSRTIARVGGQAPFGFDYVITRDNPLLPASVAALMDANALGSITVSRTDRDNGANVRRLARQTYTGVAKLDGTLTSSIKWSAFAQYGEFTNNDVFAGERVVPRFYEAIDVVSGPNGPMCRSATARAAGCLPLNIFGPNAATPAALAYFQHDETTLVTNTQTVFGGQINGDLFSLPAGPLAFSLGAEYRRETTKVVADPLSVRGELFDKIGADLTGRFDVKEVFGEVSVPLFRDQPFAKSLEVDGAVRISDYSTIGTTTTWKGGVVYAPVEDIRLRLTRSRSVRAPNLSELFNSGALSNSVYLDPCDATQINSSPNRAKNCAALGIPAGYVDPLLGVAKFVQTGGNPNLAPERSDSLTVGVVLKPSFLPGLSASVDYFDIKIDRAINTLPINNILSGCVDGPTPSPLLCSQIIRRADGGITQVDVSPLNVGSLRARGIDFNADYRTRLGTLGSDPLMVGLSVFGSYYIKNAVIADRSKPDVVLNYAGSILVPKFRGNATASVDVGPLSIAWTARYISPTKADLNVGSEYRDDNNVARRLYNDIYVKYDLTSKFQVGAGVNNLFDTHPPFSADTYTGTFGGSLYDNVGTYFFLTAGVKF